MPKRTSVADDTPIRVVIVTLDSHLASAIECAEAELRRTLPGLRLTQHCAADYSKDPAALERCLGDIAQGDIIMACMLFLEDHIKPVLPALHARRDDCDAMLACLSASEVVKLTRLGGFKLDGSQQGFLSKLKKLRGKPKANGQVSTGARQLAMLRQIPRILRFIPGAAQDARQYFLTLQYWLAGSTANVTNMVAGLVNRYAAGPRERLRGRVKANSPIHYPEVGLYHPAVPKRIAEKLTALPRRKQTDQGTVGVLVMRAYVLADNTRHYDAVIEALEARDLRVIPAFASGLDAREAVERFFLRNGQSTVDAVVSLTGFSLVGGPAYNDSKAAEDLLSALDVPYVAAHATEFQSIEEWEQSDLGLQPIETTMMVAIPELDGAVSPILFGGRSTQGDRLAADLRPQLDRVDMLARRVSRLITLRKTPRADRRIAAVVFDFPPNSGATGTAAHLDVMASLLAIMVELRDSGYSVEVPDSVDALRDRLLHGNTAQFGTAANLHHRIPADDHVRAEPWLQEIEAQWGPAPGRQLTDGRNLFVLGAEFGNLFVGVQPGFGYEGDPMRLLFEKGFAPTHAFSAFYRYLREDYAAHAVLHVGTHGALEFMPGKQSGMSAECWPDRLIGDLPNFYLYAANNPSEGTIAKRRSAATMISYVTPPITHAGLYRGLTDLKSSIDRWRALEDQDSSEGERLASLIQAEAAELDLVELEPGWREPAREIETLLQQLRELEATLIPFGLHTLGQAPEPHERADLLGAMSEAATGSRPDAALLDDIVAGRPVTTDDDSLRPELERLADIHARLVADNELPAVVHALDGGFVPPVAGGDLLRNPDILPTGRNLHGFDPFRIPSAFAVADGALQVERLLARHRASGHAMPESIAMVLWGTDNLKSEGAPIGQALALYGAKPRFDSYGRLSGADLIPLEKLGRPRIDVVLTLSGIFRDLMPNQTRLLAEAALLASSADEPLEQNFVRKHTLAHMEATGCDLETAALRVFSNAAGAYGSNVNMLVDNGRWEESDELAETYERRKCFAYGRSGAPVPQAELLKEMLAGVDLAYQNLESSEVGVTTIDNYFDTLGGISLAVKRARGDSIEVYIGDQTTGDGVVRTLDEQVGLEHRTRVLNPKWHEAMLHHGYEGVRQIEAAVTNTLGWSATTGKVKPWVYKQITQTFVLDKEMRDRLATLNPAASAKVANRLLEAYERSYWTPDEETLQALQEAGEELEDRLEGVGEVNIA
ncbi:MAG: magnesium chelatase subunit H [Pseudomonadota bacterium]